MSSLKRFSHLYVERGARADPLTQRLLRRFARAVVVEIDDYQEVFGRAGQDFAAQKQSPKLILARKKDSFLYAGSAYVQDFAYPNFSYNALALNCPYDCRYCYLQGLFASAHQVVFTNLDDYFTATTAALEALAAKGERMHLALSYDTDLLALEGLTGYTVEWLHYTRAHPNLSCEVRTKSAAFRPLREEAPSDRFILAWTLSPTAVVERYEPGTAPLRARLEAAREAQEAGWPVRLCFDPILRLPGWQALYRGLLEETFRVLDPDRIENASAGVFRMNADTFSRLRKLDRTDLLHYPYERATNTISYGEEERADTLSWFENQLSAHLPRQSIYLWT